MADDPIPTNLLRIEWPHHTATVRADVLVQHAEMVRLALAIFGGKVLGVRGFTKTVVIVKEKKK